MKKRADKKESNFGHPAVFFLLVLAALAAVVMPPGAARAAQEGYGLSSGLISIEPGRSASLTLRSKGDKPVVVRLQYVNKEGKVLSWRDAVINPGKSEAFDYTHPGGANSTTEVMAQFGNNTKRSIGLLMPTLRVIDQGANSPVRSIGREGFTEIRPIWVPSLRAAELIPGPHE